MRGLTTGKGFKPDHESFARFLMSQQALEPVREAAKDVAGIAKQNEGGSGEYANNFTTAEGPAMTFDGNTRRTMRVINDKPYAARREFGARPDHRGATRGLRTAGAKVGELNGEIG